MTQGSEARGKRAPSFEQAMADFCDWAEQQRQNQEANSVANAVAQVVSIRPPEVLPPDPASDLDDSTPQPEAPGDR